MNIESVATQGFQRRQNENRHSPSELVRSLKSASSRVIRAEFKNEVDAVYRNNVFWHHSYFMISVGGAPLETLKKYIEGQDRPQ